MKTVYDQVYEALSSEQPADIITHHKRVDLSVVTTGNISQLLWTATLLILAFVLVITIWNHAFIWLGHIVADNLNSNACPSYHSLFQANYKG